MRKGEVLQAGERELRFSLNAVCWSAARDLLRVIIQ